ncbi:unnamed protein product [Schistosoma curassoni]|uniref:Uncharacterized protein n=1 Tax=Schistosoma curassoni TaxID=6186 RepID=A0A183KLW3_9TREM|nr:unnamed protein product [Schistosoma curassoni]
MFELSILLTESILLPDSFSSDKTSAVHGSSSRLPPNTLNCADPTE